MRFAATTTIVAAALFLAPAAALATTASMTKTTATSSTTTTSTSSSSTSTTPATVPTTSITTTTPGSSGTSLPLAPPRPANLASGRAALNAYAAYLQTLVDSESAGQANDATYISTVENGEGGCKSSLEPLTESADAVRPAVQDTLTALGKEMGDDLALNYDQIAEVPLGKLATVLEHLKWVHRGRNSDVLDGYITAETALISLTQSNLCQDALLAASKPTVTPVGTRTFLAQFDQSAKAASAGLGGFLVLLRAYATTAERPLLQRITTLAGEFASASKMSLLASGQQLTTSLETS